MSESGRPAALITGSAVRIGRAFALHLAAKGYDIALHYHSSEAEAEKTQADIEESGVVCAPFRRDLADKDLVERLIPDVLDTFPRLSVLINCASVYFDAPARETTRDQLDLCMAVNFAAPYVLVREFASRLDEGLVINILDNKIAFHQYHYSPYLLSKKALAEFTVQAALEFAPGLRVNGISPGVILPASWRSPEYLEWRLDGIPLHRQGDPSHLMKALDYLLENDFVTAQILTVDGGEGQHNVGRNFANYED